MTGALLLRTVAAALDAAGIPFMLTGSVAAAWHGAGRATMDVDLVIDPTADQLRALVAALAGPDVYVSLDAALEAFQHRAMFNVVNTTTGWKADLIVRKLRPFSEAEFARRRPIDFEGARLWVASAEDVIISKLEWAKLGGSARQIEDVAELIRTAGQLDDAYLEHWIAELGLLDQWRAARQAAGFLD
jgi:hypothetical protein